MGKNLTGIAQQLKEANKKVQVIYAFNGTGKTRLSREFKQQIDPKPEDDDAPSSELADNKILYYSAFTEDSIRQLVLSAFLDRVYGPRHDFDAALVGTPGELGLGYLLPLAQLSGLDPPVAVPGLLRFFADSLPVAFVYHARGLQGLNRRVRGIDLGLRGELATVSRCSVEP